MLLRTYEKITELFERNNGYLSFDALRKEKITITQMNELVEKGVLQRFSRGWYWYQGDDAQKPENYRMIEICKVNSKAVVCADSACYYWGLLKKEPEKLSFATKRTDRSSMEVIFPVSRHYFSDYAYALDKKLVETPYGNFSIYDMDKSVCDCIRFREELGEETLKEILIEYAKHKDSQVERMLAYADQMRVGRIARTYIENK